MIDASFARYLVETGREKDPILRQIETPEHTILIALDKEGDLSSLSLSKALPPIEREFHTIDGFAAYLSGPHSPATTEHPGMVLFNVHHAEAIAWLTPHTPRRDRAFYHPRHTDEYRALGKLTHGVTQHELWRLLVTDLADSIPPEILLAISDLSVRSKSEEDAEINLLGIKSEKRVTGYSIVTHDAKGQARTAEIPATTKWIGPIYEDTPGRRCYEIDLRLEVTTNPLRFIFHAQSLAQAVRRADHDLERAIKDAIPSDRYTVHEGA